MSFLASSHSDALGSLARTTGLPPSMGKASSEIKVRVPDEIKELFRRRACELGMDESRLLRELLIIWIYGEEGARTLKLKELELVARLGAGLVPQHATSAEES